MSAVSEVFERTRSEGRAALIGYLPAGFPSVADSIEAFKAIAASGVDLVEIGLPYSDPLMDGPTIQAAVDVARAAGVRTTDVLDIVRAVTASGVPAMVMSYWNPIEKYGVERFARDLAAAGGSGVITPDVIPEEAGAWLAAAASYDLDPVFVVAPSSTTERLRIATEACRGFVYAASTMGVTGVRDAVSGAAQELVSRVRQVTGLPVAVGLGVSNADQAREVAAYADGVIVGSAFVRRLLDATGAGEGAGGTAAGIAKAAALASELRQGVSRVAK